MMRLTLANVDRVSAVVYTGGSLLAAAAFFLATLLGDYNWVARLGGAGWVFLLAMIILMPTVMPVLRSRVTGEKVSFAHDHEAMLREEAMRQEERSKPMATAKDPVCGMDVEPATAAGSSEYKGQTYYFCNLSCKRSFDADPEKYLSGGSHEGH